MTFAWTPHRFSGGTLAFDVANSVVLRFDPDRRIDRFDDPVQLDLFVPAARTHGAERDLLARLAPPSPGGRERFLRLREEIDGYFRARATGLDTRERLASLLEAIAANLRAAESGDALDAATALSALRLVSAPEQDRIKICANCGWLFLDRSKNRSRTWCDMAVCGNRTKAHRHYRKKKEALS